MSKLMPCFAVVTPTLNSIDYLTETVYSVVSQSRNVPVNYLIVDGGSKDGTSEYLKAKKKELESKSARKKYNINFDYIIETDNGIYDALAKGFAKVTGDIYCYINASDFFFPNSFQTVAKFFSAFPSIRWLTGMNSFCDEKGSLIDVRLPYKYRKDYIQSGIYGYFLDHIQQESTFWHASLLKTVNFQELCGFKFAGDFYLWNKFSYEAHLYIAHAQLGCFRIHRNQISSNLSGYKDEVVSMIGGKPGILKRVLSFPHRICWRLPSNIKCMFSDSILNLSL